MNNKMEIKRFYDEWWDKSITDIGWNYEQNRIHNIVFEFLNKSTIINDTILEIGCGEGDLTKKLSKKYKNLISFDISTVGVKKAKKRIMESNCELEGNCEFLLCDATILPFRSHIFDTVILSETLEHIIDQESCIEEIYRIIKYNGYLVLTMPNSGGINRNVIKLFCRLSGKSYISNEQIIDKPLSTNLLKALLSPYFRIEKKKGLYYVLPYLDKIGSIFLIKLSKGISEFIEERNMLSNYGLYQCLLLKSV